MSLKKSNCQLLQLPWEQLFGQQITVRFCRPDITRPKSCHLCILLYICMSYIHCNQINTTGGNSRAGTAYPSGARKLTPVFSGVRVNRSMVLCVCFCRSLFVLVYRLSWQLCCLFFFNIRILIAPLVSSSSSYNLIDFIIN